MPNKKIVLSLSALAVLALGSGVYFANFHGQATTAKQGDTKTLIVYAAGPKPLSDKIVKGFEKKSGIKVKTFDGTTGKILNK